MQVEQLIQTITLAAIPILFGWAKPVPVNFAALRRPKQDMLWVAIAGPASNLAMALGWAMVFKAVDLLPANYFTQPLMLMSKAGIEVNVILMLLNLLPILPLDGGRILASLLPQRMAWRYARLEPWGLPLLVLLLMTNVLDDILNPLVGLSHAVIRAVVL